MEIYKTNVLQEKLQISLYMTKKKKEEKKLNYYYFFYYLTILLDLGSNEMLKILKSSNALRFGCNTDLDRIKGRSTSTDCNGCKFHTCYV